MIRTILLAAAVLASSALANPTQTFAQGSLIIPMEATLQTECGTTSAYGLVWKILYENRPGGAFSGNPVIIYWSINGSKASNNRCTPTNLHKPPTSGAATTWEDGCDFSITNTTRQPAVMVDYGIAPPMLPLLYANGALTHFTTTSAKGRPYWATSSPTAEAGQAPGSSDLNDTITSPARFTTIRYSGAPFIIDASDAKRVIDVIRTVPHITKHTLTGGTDGVNRCTYIGGGDATQRNYRVLMHQATTSFTAPVYKRISNVPPKVALLDYGAGVKTVLQKYLDGAGLNGTIAGAPVSGDPTASAPTYGLVYDRLRAIDDLVSTGAEPNGYLNSVDGAGKARYKVFWAPHWRVDASSLLAAKSGRTGCVSACDGSSGHDTPCSWGYAGNGGGTTECDATAIERANALDNLVFFANKKGNGIMAQCRSIAGFEAESLEYDGAWNSRDGTTVTTAGVNATPRFQYTNGIDQNALGPAGAKWNASWNGRNCSDPDYLAVTPIADRNQCHVYPYPAEAFGQIGDFAFNTDDGAVSHWRPYQNVSARRANLKRLAMTWDDYDSSVTTEGVATPSGYGSFNANGNDVVTLNQKDDDPEKATIIYIGAHDISSSVGGTRIILNTLLNLGADPVESDRSMAQASTAIDITNGNLPTLFTSVFQVLIGTLLPDTITFTDANGKNFRFPLTHGAVRARDANALATGLNELSDNVLWNSDSQMPPPADRNLFTAFGGTVEESPALSGGRVIKNNIAQHYWVPARVEASNLNATISPVPNPACTDVVTWENYTDKHKGANTGGLVRVAGGDGICDLAQALQYTNFAWDVDAGGKKKKPADLQTKMAAALPEVEQFVQVVRGFCYAKAAGSRLLTPTDTQCAAYNATQDNRAHMGGAVNSTAAIVPPSGKIVDSGAPRPTVAYVGGYDGQLHAIYVGGGSGYTGPAGGLNFIDFNTGTNSGFTLQPTWTAQVHPAHTFKTNFAAQFAAGTPLPPRGRELWAYLPSTQLPLLKSNAAKIDSSPVVQDVFADFDGDGVRKWHTVLVCSLGGTSRQIFAMDVTNPLQPVLLWDIVGTNTSGLNFLSAARSDWRLSGDARPLDWDNRTADFVLPPIADSGRNFGYAYDFGDMGGSRALALAELRLGLEPTYVVFVAANSSAVARDVGCTDCAAADAPSKGLLVAAIDVATGQKLWSWSQSYLTGGAGFRSADNTVPPPPAIRIGPNGASTLLVGDMEGRLWELDAATGQNVHALRNGADCATAACNFAAYDTQGTDTNPEPITSTIALTKVPAAPSGVLAAYGNDTVAIFATRGTNWVPRTVGGNLSTLLLDTQRHRQVLSGAASVRTDARNLGVMVNPATMPLPLAPPDRVYGNITVSGQMVFVPIVTPPAAGVYDDPLQVSGLLTGKTLMLDLGGLPASVTGTELANFSFANFGGVAAFNIDTGGGVIQSTVISDQIAKTSKYRPAAGPVGTNKTAANAALRANNAIPYRLYNVIRRFLSQQ